MVDPLEVFHNLESCPNCGCLTKLGALRCPECGSFHTDLNSLPDRDPPPPAIEPPPPKDLDPTLYSLNPAAELPEENIDEEEPKVSTKLWDDSSTDFAFDDSIEYDSMKERVESQLPDDDDEKSKVGGNEHE